MSAEVAIANEEILVIETPERVPLHFALASIGNRFLACAFDHALQTIAIALLYIILISMGNMFNLSGMGGASKWAMVLLIIVGFIIWTSYFVIFEWRWNGQTQSGTGEPLFESNLLVAAYLYARRRVVSFVPRFVLRFWRYYSSGIQAVFKRILATS